MIPTEIPERLREGAIVPEFAGEYEAVWPIAGALEVLESLEWSKIAVTRAQGCAEMGATLVPTSDVWVLSEMVGETEIGRARKSRATAARFVRGLKGGGFVMLEFSYQDDAA
jgi:hypothetical protein